MPTLLNKTVALYVLFLIVFGALTGCVSLAPKYERPAAPIEGQYNVQSFQSDSGLMVKKEAGVPDAVALLGEVFADVRLQGLLALALENNRDLRVAALNIAQARAQYGIQKAASLPSLNATATGSSSRTPADLLASGQSTVARQYAVSLGVTAYELDFFGRIRSLKDNALEQFLATEQAYRTVHLSLATEVANTWFNWSAGYDRLTLAKGVLHSQRETLGLMQKRFDLGHGTAIQLRQQQVVVANARSEVARLIGSNAKNRNALTLLIGSSVPDDLVPIGFGGMTQEGEPLALTDIPTGLPSELMLRRPDLLQSEHALKAAHANIGVARAAFYPSIRLNASVGTISAELGNLFESGSKTWAFVPQISLPIFAGGANRANLKIVKTARDIALANYEKSIQAAFREVSDTLVDRVSIAEQLSAQHNLVAASAQAYSLTKARYDKGLDSWLDVLNAERTYTSARAGLIGVYTSQLTNRVNLYKVLGGDWGEYAPASPG